MILSILKPDCTALVGKLFIRPGKQLPTSPTLHLSKMKIKEMCAMIKKSGIRLKSTVPLLRTF